MFQRILLPTDGSEGMSTVVETALDLATKYGTAVHALYVIDVRTFLPVPEQARESVRDALLADGKEATAAVVDAGSAAGVEVVPVIDQGIPHEAVIEYATENDIDLIVMGTHGLSASNQALGSVAQNVVTSSPVSVLTVRLGEVAFEHKTERGVM